MDPSASDYNSKLAQAMSPNGLKISQIQSSSPIRMVPPHVGIPGNLQLTGVQTNNIATMRFGQPEFLPQFEAPRVFNQHQNLTPIRYAGAPHSNLFGGISQGYRLNNPSRYPFLFRNSFLRSPYESSVFFKRASSSLCLSTITNFR